MSNSAFTLIALVASLVAALWAAMLALAEGSPRVARSMADAPTSPREPVPLYRAVQVSRLALLAFAGVAAAVAIEWWARKPVGAITTVLVAGAFLYMVSDALPRMIGTLAPDLASAAAWAARRSLAPLRPILGLVAHLERLADRLVPGARKSTSSFGASQRDMLLGVFSLRDTTVSEIMSPRLDITAIENGATWPELVELVRPSEHARLPVYADSLDNIAGVLYAKDLVAAVAGVSPVPKRWQDLIRPAQFVPESKTLTAQLRDFQGVRGNIAIVVDEFGGTSGLITLEDIVEEVVGEIHDEYDADEMPAVEREGEDRFWVEGSVTVDELSTLLGTSLDNEEVSTVGGLVYSELGRVPRPGEELRIGEFRVVVEKVVRRRIKRVYFERVQESRSVSVPPEEQR